MTARLYPLRRTRSYKSDRHLALDEHALMHGYSGDDFPEPFMVPAPPRPIPSVEHDWPLVWVVYAAGICAGLGGSALWRLFT